MYDGKILQATKRHRNKKDKRRHNVVGDRAAKAGAPGTALKSLERKNKLKDKGREYIALLIQQGIGKLDKDKRLKKES
ncbi:hypothetical protein I7I51_04034 [Histoplasma capsulatum]|uniref:Uncharacterized protein n=1 Tax=Ajellomyces capsulatus TaxID=5037 RepID=A0A8A1MCI0_AJECA|nr:hypothetical protein I7I51_04034 [Histoplasma capsulatum]